MSAHRAALAVATCAAALATTAAPAPAADPAPITSIRPTGVGLPDIGQAGTIGAAELVPALRAYHDSGAYDRDLARVGRSARSWLTRRLGARRPPRRPALVLDVDETSLSNYAGLAAAGFAATGTTTDVVGGTGMPIAPTLALFAQARRRHVAVFFVTGRPEALRGITASNLRAAGFAGWTGLSLKATGASTVAYKAGERRRIERRGYTIVANVGDQDSDLAGGYAERAFKLPNPFYFIP